jgi:hypothetical protein
VLAVVGIAAGGGRRRRNAKLLGLGPLQALPFGQVVQVGKQRDQIFAGDFS